MAEDCMLPEDYEVAEEWKGKWGWSDQREHETWWLFDSMSTDWIDVEDYHIWVDYHKSARLVLFHDKKMDKEMQEMYDREDKMGMFMGRNY